MFFIVVMLPPALPDAWCKHSKYKTKEIGYSLDNKVQGTQENWSQVNTRLTLRWQLSDKPHWDRETQELSTFVLKWIIKRITMSESALALFYPPDSLRCYCYYEGWEMQWVTWNTAKSRQGDNSEASSWLAGHNSKICTKTKTLLTSKLSDE